MPLSLRLLPNMGECVPQPRLQEASSVWQKAKAMEYAERKAWRARASIHLKEKEQLRKGEAGHNS